MSKKAFGKIAEGLAEAIAVARGEAEPARVTALMGRIFPEDIRYDGIILNGPADNSLPEGITQEMADAGTLAFIDAVAAEASAECAAIKIYRAMAGAAPRAGESGGQFEEVG